MTNNKLISLEILGQLGKKTMTNRADFGEVPKKHGVPGGLIMIIIRIRLVFFLFFVCLYVWL